MLTISMTQPVLRAQLEVIKSHDALQDRAEREARRFHLEDGGADMSRRETRDHAGPAAPARAAQPAQAEPERQVTPGPYGTPRLLNVVV